MLEGGERHPGRPWRRPERNTLYIQLYGEENRMHGTENGTSGSETKPVQDGHR